jgi:(S)-2-hydroxyglutarate dehydrogenase
MRPYDFAVVGGGIVGLSTAMALQRRYPRSRLLVLEKESRLAAHQTGHNSGVIHSGVYYRPGSYKASLARAGCRSMIAFCRDHGIPHEICGKVIVAAEEWELPLLASVRERGVANGVEVRELDAAELREREPHVRGLAALLVPAAGIVDFRAVAAHYARLIEEAGGEIRLGCKVVGVPERAGGVVIETDRGKFEAATMVNCAGLHADRIARLAGVPSPARIVPFRGEYYELKPEKRHLVRHLVYPVPNPSFPFLGVHLTRMIDGSVHAGPNAVLAMAREGYRKRDVSLRDTADYLRFSGFWRLARKHFADGLAEVRRSVSRRAFVQALQRLVPEIDAEDVSPAPAGVRAQAINPDGTMVDDFLILEGARSVHVYNAPSPAATASIEIGEFIADQVARLGGVEPA